MMSYSVREQIKLMLKLLALVILSTASANASESLALKQLWSIKGTFKMPESVAFDAKRDLIYISNVNHFAKDGNGFISKVSLDGKLVKLKWIEGLHSPTGMAIYQDVLYVADVDALVAIDLNKQAIMQRFSAPDAAENPVLNDVAIARNGTVYVSGSASRKIYQLARNKLALFVQDREALKLANGLYVEDTKEEAYLVHGGKFWNYFSIKSARKLEKGQMPDKSLYDFDGITSDGNGGYFFTVINDPRIWHLNNQGQTRPLSEKPIQGIDILFDIETGKLFVPQVGGGLSVFRLVKSQN